MAARTAGRKGRPWRTLRAQVLAEETHCWLCGILVDQRLSGRHPKGPSVDHVVPLSKGGQPHDRANLRLAHTGCNSGRRDRAPDQVRGRVIVGSRAW